MQTHGESNVGRSKRKANALVIVGALALNGLVPMAFAQDQDDLVILAQAEGREIETDAIDRINHANLLPMLTQRVAAASCAVTSGVDVEEAHDVLEQGNSQFETILAGLQHGNEDLHIIGAEPSRRIVADIEHVRTEWAPVHDAILVVLEDGTNVDAAHVIDDHNLPLYDATNRLLTDISGRYSNPYELTQADAFIYGLMARQRTLSQQMAKDACEIWTGYHAQEAKDDLNTVMSIFENSLFALRDGMPELGVRPAPTEEIRVDLDDLIGRWHVIKPNLQDLVDGVEIAMDAKYEIFHDFNVELAQIDVLATHYRDYTERAH